MNNPSADEQLQNAIMEEFAWNILVEPAQLDVTVNDGVATVVGTVTSVAEKRVALNAAEMVGGVRDVVSGIEVKLTPDGERSDAELYEVIGRVLDWDALVPELDLTHRVSNGWVTLSGQVPTERQRQEAERAVEHVGGVRGVTNNVTLKAPSLSPESIHTVIADALLRRAAHHAKHIDLTIDGHHVTLTGKVVSPLEKRAVLGAVSHAPGVEIVCDRLTVSASA